jgi:hypothetical protein
LAGEASADRVNGNSVCLEPIGSEFADVIVTGHSRPVRQHLPAEGVDLAEGDGLKSARPLQTEIEAADAREK